MYTMEYNKFTRRWLVINVATGIAHSFWSRSQDARQTAGDLNRIYNRTLKALTKSPVRSLKLAA